MVIQKGAIFTGKWFTGKIEVTKIEGNNLFVSLQKKHETHISNWNEIWNLEHTESGFDRGDYFPISESELAKYKY